jgi:Fe-S cluster assembly protein SufD
MSYFLPLPPWLESVLSSISIKEEIKGLPSSRMETWGISDFRNLPENLNSFQEICTNRQARPILPLWGHSEFSLHISDQVIMKGEKPQGLFIEKKNLSDDYKGGDQFVPHNPFPQINHALCGEKVSIKIATSLDSVIDVLLSQSNLSMVHKRLSIDVDEGVNAKIALTLQDFALFSTSVIDFNLEKNSKLEMFVHHVGDTHTHTITSFNATTAQNSTLQMYMIEEGGGISRIHHTIQAKGQHSCIKLQVMSLISKGFQADHIATINHRACEIQSQQTFKALVASQGKHQSISKTAVQKEGQKTDAYQKLAAILLGEDALHFARPELEIWADDVKCAHGSTVGQLDETALYYLRTRGLPETEAKALLMEAFVFEDLDSLEWCDSYKESLKSFMSQWMRGQ